MTTAVLTQLSFAALWALAGSLATGIVITVRRDRADAAREDAAVAAEYGDTLERWRPTMDAARHVRPAWLPTAGRSGWARLTSAVSGLSAWMRSAVVGLVARQQTSPAAVEQPVAAPPYPGRDVNSFTWPVNPAPQPVATFAAGRAPVDVELSPGLNFAEEIRVRNEWLHRQAQSRLDDADATGLIPVQSGVPA